MRINSHIFVQLLPQSDPSLDEVSGHCKNYPTEQKTCHMINTACVNDHQSKQWPYLQMKSKPGSSQVVAEQSYFQATCQDLQGISNSFSRSPGTGRLIGLAGEQLWKIHCSNNTITDLSKFMASEATMGWGNTKVQWHSSKALPLVQKTALPNPIQLKLSMLSFPFRLSSMVN